MWRHRAPPEPPTVWFTLLHDQYDSHVRGGDGSAIGQQTTRNEADIRARQSGARVPPGKAVVNEVSGRVRQSQREAAGAIDKGRREVSEDGSTFSEKYRASVRAGKVSPNHGGNRAVWDTVGANATSPEIGTPLKPEPIGEWHFGKDGVPIAGPGQAEATRPDKDLSGKGKELPRQ